MPTPDINATLQSAGVQWAIAGIGVLLLLTLLREIPRIPRRLLVLMAAAFLDMVGLLMVVPLLPFYVKRFSNDGQGLELLGVHVGTATLIGVVVASFTLAQSISAPRWGRFSDKHGRRPALMIALGASTLAFLVFAFADSLWLLLLSRVIQGLGGGTVGVIQAYVSDTTEPAQRARALGWLSASTNLGVALGPVLGSLAVKLGDLSWWDEGSRETVGYAAPGVLAAALCLITMAFAWRFLRESNEKRAETKARIPIWTATKRVVSDPLAPASRLILTYAIAIGAFVGTTAMLAFYLDRRFGIDETTIGYVFLWIGAISVFTRVLALGPLVDRFGEFRLSRAGILLLLAGMLALPFASSLPSLAIAIALLPLGTAFTFPCVTALLSRVVDQAHRGMYMGLQQTFGGMSRIVTPLLGGLAFDHIGSTSPFYGSAVVLLLTLPLGLGLTAAVRKSAAQSTEQ